MLIAVLLLLGGLAALTLSADRFVLSAARLSRAFGLSPVLVGALVVGLGTSAPEILVSSLAAGRGEIDIAVGNIIGSNTANLTLVLGSTALVTVVISQLKTIRREGALMFGAMALSAGFLWDLEVTRWEAGILLACLAGAVTLLVLWARQDAEAGHEPGMMEERTVRKGDIRVGFEAAIGFGALVLTLGGAEALVRGATRLAAELDISSAFVGLVIVSVGTSLPELATALAAARRNETDLVLGNVVGSNLFNALGVLGIAGLIGPGTVADQFHPVMILMLVAAALAGVFVITARRLERWEGALLLVMFMGLIALSV